MAFNPIGRIRVNVTGARGPVGIDIEGSPSDGQVLVKTSAGPRTFAGASSLPAGSVVDTVNGSAPDQAPSQRAVNETIAPIAVAAASATWNNVGNFSPTLTLGGIDQAPSLENGRITGHLDLTANQAFVQIAGTARDKTAPAGGFSDTDRVLLEGLPFAANGIIPQWLKLEPGSGFPSDTEAYLVGDTIAFYRPGRVPVTANDLADNYYIRVTGTVAILPPEASA